MKEVTDNNTSKTRKIRVPFESCGDKPYIFASYGHDDKDAVFPLLRELYESGWNVWYDEGITIGAADYNNVIRSQIDGCSVFLLFATTWSLSRPYIIEKEIKAAREDGIDILPLFIKAEGETEVYVPKDVSSLLPSKKYRSIEEIDRELKKRKIGNFGKREAKGIEREVAEEWFDGHDLARAGKGGNLVGCEETPYVYLAFDRGDTAACNPYAKELYYAGYNVRSCENGYGGTQKAMLTDENCRAYVPFVTKKYIESGLLERDYGWAKESGKLVIPLLMNDCDEKELPVIPPRLADTFGVIHGLAAREFRPIDFLSKLEARLEELDCCVRGKSGGVERRSFQIPDFLYEFTEDGKGIILTKYTGYSKVVKPERVYSGFRVRGFGEGAFGKCEDITEVVLPSGLKNINDSLFSCCSSLKKIDIPDGVTEIGNNAFFQCLELEKVTIPDTVEKIGGGAFFNCFSLKTLKIPDSVNEIGNNIVKKFSGCTVYCSWSSYAGKYCRENLVKYTTPFKIALRRIALILLIAALAAGTYIQLAGIFDIIGWLSE